jgi:hypothetical protein
MNAAEIAQNLGGARAEGKEWRCDCPLCNHHNLTLCDNGGHLRVTCFNGCTGKDVVAELRRRGLYDRQNGNGGAEQPDVETQAEHEARAASANAKRQARIDNALDIWRNSVPATNTMVATYLASRLLLGPIAPAVRFAPTSWHKESGARYPAMVGLVEHVRRGAVGFHADFLNRLDASVRATIR